MSSFFVALTYCAHAYWKTRDPECNALSLAIYSIYSMCIKCTHIFKLAVARVTSSLSFMGNGTLWPFQIYEILLSKGISRSEKKKSRSCPDAFTVSCVSKNVKEKYNGINCELSTFSFSLFKCSLFSFLHNTRVQKVLLIFFIYFI